MKSEFTTFDIIKALNIKRGRLRQWQNLGFVKPSIKKPEGQGTKALFSYEDVLFIAFFREFWEKEMKNG